MPVRIQLRRTKGWRMPAGAVKVDRSTKWGNPFRERDLVWLAVALGFRGDREGRIEASVELFRRWRGLPHQDGPLAGQGVCGVAINIHVLMHGDRISVQTPPDPKELRGCDLACWCRLDQPCHADVLLELANAPVQR